MTTAVVLDLARWRAASDAARAVIAEDVDRALASTGLVVLVGHGVDPAAAHALRTAARALFALPAPVKARYATTVAGRGWIPMGREANGYAGDTPDAARPDLVEGFTCGRLTDPDRTDPDASWFAPNVWPAEVPELEARCVSYLTAVHRANTEFLRVCAVALGLDAEWFVRRTTRSPDVLKLNRYPPRSETGPPAAGQYRIGPHTDWGLTTVLDREIGRGGLQVQLPDGRWIDAPHVPGGLLVNAGDLLARWTGDRWRSTVHRVLPPPAEAPDEELLSLVAFFEGDLDAVVEPLPASAGRHTYPPVRVGAYLRARAEETTIVGL